jgi:hypothetical protein
LKDLIDNADRWEKYRNSLSGHVAHLQIVCTHTSLLGYVNRVWDEGGDYQSIPNAYMKLLEVEAELIDWHVSSIEILETHEDLRNHLNKKVVEVQETFEKLAKSDVRAYARVLRSENFAHLIENSRDRRKLEKEMQDYFVTNNDLLDFAAESIVLSEGFTYLSIRLVNSFDASCRVFQKYCDLYWQSLPVFRVVEQD